MTKAKTNAASGPLVHLAVLAVSAAAAIGVWTRDKEPKAQGDVTVWSGRAADVERFTYESKTRKVELAAKSDAVGRYFVGTAEREAPAAGPEPDGGAPAPAAPRT
ncbi:MAG: hypothetical protein ABI134_13260, partial [Byssovorax sp.]